jgi:hypothetical protein
MIEGKITLTGMKDLKKIGLEEWCDKTDEAHTFQGESYLDVYDRIFAPLRLEHINLLELGVWQGKSLRMWRKYFVNANIHGVDINPDILNYDFTGCTAHLISQDDMDLLHHISKFYGGWDIVIDDASHLNHLTEKSFNILWKFVKPKGYYIIEDLRASYEDLSDTPEHWNGVNLHPEKQNRNNNRGVLDKLFSEIIRNIDYAKGDIRSIQFYHQMAIIQKI